MADDFPDFVGDTSADNPIKDLGSPRNESFGGVIETAGDHDVFAVQLTAGTTYGFFVNGQSSNGLVAFLPDPFLGLLAPSKFDSSAVQITADNDSGTGNDPFIPFMATTTGTYWLDVSGAGGTTGLYNVGGLVFDVFQGAAETTSFLMIGELANPTLSDFAETQFAFGKQIGVPSPTVYMFQALGLALADSAPALQNGAIGNPNTTSDPDFVNLFYGTVFGVQPNAAQVQAFVSQLDFFKSIYVGSGAFGTDLTHIEVLARAAVIGQMLGVQAVDAISNASAATANLSNDSDISTVGVSAAMHFDLL
jgi:hypothetical protein